MKIQWIKRSAPTSAITIYNNNITLSKQAADYLSDCFGLQVGYDKEVGKVVLKKIFKEDIEKKYVSQNMIYSLTIKKSFGRINNRQLVNELSQAFSLDFKENKSYKFPARYNTGDKMLIINIRGDENE